MANMEISLQDITSKTMVMNPTVLEDAEDNYVTEVSCNEVPLNWLANAISDGIALARHDAKVPERLAAKFDNYADLVTAVTKVALGARISQIHHLRGFDKRNFVYPSVLTPILAKYGEVRNQEEAYTIKPVWSEDLKKDLDSLGALEVQKSKGDTDWTRNTQFHVPDWYEEAVHALSHFGIMAAYGLPKDTTTDDEQIYQVTVEGDRIIGKRGVSEEFVLTSAFISASKLADLYGAYRTLYGGIRMVRSAIETIGARALHDVIGR